MDSWTKELDGSVKEFVRQAGEVREWDKVLVRTGSQVRLAYMMIDLFLFDPMS